MMASCIRLDMECAAICYATAQLISMNSDQAAQVSKICAASCEACAAECRKHDTDHCLECAAACEACAAECMKMLVREFSA